MSASRQNGRVPLLDVAKENRPLRRAVQKRWEGLWQRGDFVLGQELRDLESAMARYLGAAHAIGCASGTDALRLALKASGIGPGDEVITTAFSFYATAGAILQEGATPVFADIHPDTCNIDTADMERRIGPKTKAIVPVHLYGLPADMDAIGALAKKHSLAVVEDAAQALGASWKGKKAGTIGDIGCFSFYPTKNLGALGDAGMLATGSEELASKLRLLRVHGAKQPYWHEQPGINSRLDNMQAAVLNTKLPLLPEWNLARRRFAQYYRKQLQGLPLGMQPALAGAEHAYALFVVRTPRRDQLKEFLASQGVASAAYYPHALPLQPCLAHLGHKAGDFPEAERAAKEVLALPLFPQMTKAQAKKVVEAVKGFFDGSRTTP